MQDDDAIEGLKRLGLTTYEARVFLGLQKLGSGTASEISNGEDVPRSQVYGAAEGLEERGLVETQQSTPTVYRPIPLKQARTLLFDQLAQTGTETFNYLDSVQETRENQERSESIWLINARDAIVSRSVSIIDSAETRVLYATENPALLDDAILSALQDAAESGVDVVIVSIDEGVLDRIPGDGWYREYRVPEERDIDVSTGRLLVADRNTVLLSTLSSTIEGDENQEVAFWTSENPFAAVFVELVEAWFHHPFE